MRLLVVAAAAVVVVSGCVAPPEPAVDYAAFEDVRRTVAALDDVAGEYPFTVDRGVVIDPVRQRVIDRVLHDAQRFALHLTDAERRPLAALAAAVAAHVVPREVVASAQALRRDMLARRRIVLAPAAPPARARAAEQWRIMCAGCHGDTGVGDGVQGLYLEPEPKNFQDPDFILTLAPSRAFSRITDGMPGTAMPSWGIPTTSERWGLAALVFSFRHDAEAVARGRRLAERGATVGPWTALADRSDAELLADLGRRGLSGADAEDGLAYLRGEVAFAPVGGRFATVRAELAQALDHYRDRRWLEARHHLAGARRRALPRIEAIAAGDRALAARLEEQLVRLATTAAGGALEEVVQHEVVRAQALLDQAEPVLDDPDGIGAARLAVERAALAALAIGLLLGLRGRARVTVRAGIAGLVVGVVLGAAVPAGSAAAAIVLLVAVGGLGLALAAPSHHHDFAPVAALATLIGLPVGAGAQALAAGSMVAAATTVVLAVAALAAVTAVASAVVRRQVSRRRRPWLAVAALAAAAAVAVGRAGWLLWTVTGASTDLVAWSRVELLGLYPARGPLLAAAGTAGLIVVVAATRWRRRRHELPAVAH